VERTCPFDAVLLISFGGPHGLADVRPFLQNVLRGRRVLAERIEEVVHHYELFGGVSPITDTTQRQAAGLHDRLQRSGHALPVFVGMRNWHPLLADTLAEMSRQGIRRALGFIMAAHHSYSSCGQYRQNVTDARQKIVTRGLADVEISYVDSWYAHHGFIAANARRVEAALSELPTGLRPKARLLFSAHSIPLSMASQCRYEEQLRASARLVAARVGRKDWAVVYQSRSGRPEDPWLEPDICRYLREERGGGLSAVVISPIGFVADHIEVLYDLDREAAACCKELGITMARAGSAGDDPVFLDMMADIVRAACERYRGGRALPIVAAATFS